MSKKEDWSYLSSATLFADKAMFPNAESNVGLVTSLPSVMKSPELTSSPKDKYKLGNQVKRV